MSEIVSIEGPIELVDGQMMLRIPLVAGGDKLAPLGSIVVVDNKNGKFTVTRGAANDSDPQ